MKVLPAICLLLLSFLVAVGQSTSTGNSSTSSSTTTATSTAAASRPPNPNYARPDAHKRFVRYLNGMFGPIALGKVAFSAGTGTWRNAPTEWGRKWDGFGKRVASGLGKNVISSTVTYGLEESFALDGHFYRSQKKDLGSRMKNALISPFTARTREGKRVFGFPRLAGVYTANIVAAETWYPARYGLKEGVKSGTFSLGMSVLFAFAREFVLK